MKLIFSIFICLLSATTVVGMEMASNLYLNGYANGRDFVVYTLSSIKKDCAKTNNKQELNQLLETLNQSKDPFRKNLFSLIQTVLKKQLDNK